MKKFLLPLICLLLIGGGATGGYVYFIKKADAKSDEAQNDGKTGKDGHKKTEFVKMGRLILPIIGDNGVSQIVHMAVELEVTGKETAKKAKKLQPRIKDAYLQKMYGVLTREAAMRGGALKVKMISKKLKAITQKVMGENIHDVLIQSVHQRPA
jgi:flagellar FliL protein